MFTFNITMPNYRAEGKIIHVDAAGDVLLYKAFHSPFDMWLAS